MRASLQAVGETLTIDALTRLVEPHIGSSEDANLLIEALVSLEGLRLSHGWTLSEVVEAAGQAQGLEADTAAREVLTKRLDELLSLSSVSLPAKIAVVAGEHEAMFHTCRIVSDVRPVFRDDVSQAPVGVILTHDLRVDFFKDGRTESIHIAMSRSDLDSLKAAVDRAYAKLRALSGWLTSVGMPELAQEETL